MSTLSDFFARKGGASEKSVSALPGVELHGEANGTANGGANGEARKESLPASESWAEIGHRIGGDNEALRALMVDIGRRIEALDDLREKFGQIVDPIDHSLRSLEREKFDNIGLRNTLAEVRTGYDVLRNEFKELGKKLAASETEAERLRYELNQAQASVGTLETTRVELTNELEPARTKLAELEQQLAREIAAARILKDHSDALAAHGAAGDKRVAELEGELGSVREQLVLRENENRSLQNSLDQIVGENSRMSRRLAESDAAADKARHQHEQLKTALAAAEAERAKLAAAIEEANEKRQTETNTLNTRLEATSSRALAAEKLLAEVRQSLLARTEENNAAERKMADATVARNATDKKLELLQSSHQVKERQIHELEQLRNKLVDRTNALMATVKARDTALLRAEERVVLLGERVAQLEAATEANMAKHHETVEDLNTQLQCERMERTVAEGALKKARSSYADLQREFDEHVRHNGRLSERPRTHLKSVDTSPDH